MSLRRGVWFSLAVSVAALNVVAGVYAYLTNEPIHAFIHGVFAVGFGLLARYLFQRNQRVDQSIESSRQTELLQANVSELERELRETQERLDFADQLLKKKPPTT